MVQLPRGEKVVGKRGRSHSPWPSTVAGLTCLGHSTPDLHGAVSSSRLAFPSCTLLMREIAVAGMLHTLASYLSMQTVPTAAASGGHLIGFDSATTGLRSMKRVATPAIV